MPNQIKSKNTPKTYSARHLHDAHSLATNDMTWMSTALDSVRKEVERLQKAAKDGTQIRESHFNKLNTHLEMYAYLADDRLNSHAEESEKYEKEWEANKKAVSL